MTQAPVMNMDEIRAVLTKQIRSLDSGDIDPASLQTAKAVKGLGDTFLNSIRLEMEYAKMRGESTIVPLLERESAPMRGRVSASH